MINLTLTFHLSGKGDALQSAADVMPTVLSLPTM